MDGTRSGAPDHFDDLDRCGAAHDRIIDKDDAFAGEIGAARIVLQSHAEMTDLVGRLDEGPADVMVADDPELKGQPGFLGIANRRRHTRIGDRDDDVGIDRTLTGEFLPDALARLVDAATLYNAVRSREIDVLKDAEASVAIIKWPHAP